MRQIIVGGVVSFVAVAIIACSSPTTGTTGGADSADKGTSSSTSSSGSSGKASSTSSSTSSSGGSSGTSSSSTSSTSSTSSSSSSGGADAGACSPTQGVDACSTCCEAKFPAGTTKMDSLDDAFDTCACVPTVCQTQCAASECAANATDPKDGDACDTCLNGATADTCNNAWESGCQADADCKQLEACEDACDPNP